MAPTSSVPSTSIRGDGLPGHLPIMPGARVHASVPKQTTKRVPKPALDLGAATGGKPQPIPEKSKDSLATNMSKRQSAPATRARDSMWDLDPTSPKRPKWAGATSSSAEKVSQKMKDNSAAGKLDRSKRPSPFKRPVGTAKAETTAVSSAGREKANTSKPHTAKMINRPDLKVEADANAPSTQRNHRSGLTPTQRAGNRWHSRQDPEILSSDAPSSCASEVPETADHWDQRDEASSSPILESTRPVGLTHGAKRRTESWIQDNQREGCTVAERKELSPVIEDVIQVVLDDEEASPAPEHAIHTAAKALPAIPKVRVTPPSHDRAQHDPSSNSVMDFLEVPEIRVSVKRSAAATTDMEQSSTKRTRLETPNSPMRPTNWADNVDMTDLVGGLAEGTCTYQAHTPIERMEKPAYSPAQQVSPTDGPAQRRRASREKAQSAASNQRTQEEQTFQARMAAAMKQTSLGPERPSSARSDGETPQQPVATPESQALRWETGPYSDTLGQAMHNIIASLMRDLKRKEAAVHDVVTELRLKGAQYIQNVQDKHSTERAEVLDLYRKDCQATRQLSKQARHELSSLHKDLTAFKIEAAGSATAIDQLRAIAANL